MSESYRRTITIKITDAELLALKSYCKLTMMSLSDFFRIAAISRAKENKIDEQEIMDLLDLAMRIEIRKKYDREMKDAASWGHLLKNIENGMNELYSSGSPHKYVIRYLNAAVQKAAHSNEMEIFKVLNPILTQAQQKQVHNASIQAGKFQGVLTFDKRTIKPTVNRKNKRYQKGIKNHYEVCE